MKFKKIPFKKNNEIEKIIEEHKNAINLLGEKNETILIHGAGGGVGTAAIQLAQAIGGNLIGTASYWKHKKLNEMVEKLGFRRLSQRELNEKFYLSIYKCQ